MAEARRVANVTVNDGNGLLDNMGLIDSLIVDVNNQFKALVSGEYVRFQDLSVKMIQKLANLRNGIKTERESLEEENAELRRMNDELAEKVYGVPVEKAEE